MLVELMKKPATVCAPVLFELPGACVHQEEDHIVVAGTGACGACQREGKNPKTGGRPCGGYINAGYNPYPCKNCGHSYDQHH